jgi:hypothetical protein
MPIMPMALLQCNSLALGGPEPASWNQDYLEIVPRLSRHPPRETPYS